MNFENVRLYYVVSKKEHYIREMEVEIIQKVQMLYLKAFLLLRKIDSLYIYKLSERNKTTFYPHI